MPGSLNTVLECNLVYVIGQAEQVHLVISCNWCGSILDQPTVLHV